MKYVALIISILLSLSVDAQTIKNFVKKSIPQASPPRLVNDRGEVLTPDQEAALEAKLVAYDDSTSTEIVIVTIPSLQDMPIEDVSLEILRSWGVGSKEQNNGIVILAAIQEHKIWIATGYGMEGAVPDITAHSIIDNDMKPAFRGNNFYRGFDDATNSIFKAAAGEYKATPKQKSGRGGISIGKIILGFIVLMFLMNRMGGGGRGGGYMSRRGYRGIGGAPIFLPGGFGGGFGGGGGGFGGGGFGGFGGGSGGGGGAGGSW